ncbi:phage tail domain-containing protein [Caldifermentibacillus hisashii]|uniref:phage tail domain-containing protein n=1 Tax=Caldifermentibacillus hisashii TaxID=996558 RepID=UPI0031FD9BFC
MGTITEGFKRGNIHTKEFGMWLVSRSAPTPDEKTITESVPFMHGVYDFSMILGERIYENRIISYQFEIIDMNYQQRKLIQTKLENWLMKDGFAPLYDDHAPGYYYLAKCTGVDVEDTSGGLTVNVEFEAYPFKISILEEGHDIWDDFNFELDVSQPVEYQVNGTLNINLLNAGSCSVVPTITVSTAMTIQKDKITYNVPQGESRSESFRLMIGENPMAITGNGTIKFTFYKELI